MDAEKEGVQSDMALRSAAVGKTTGRQILCHFPPYAYCLAPGCGWAPIRIKKRLFANPSGSRPAVCVAA